MVVSTLNSLMISDYEEVIDNADFETAASYAKNGKYQKMLLSVSGIIYASCAISTSTLSFVLPSAECDFILSSSDKGQLSAMPLIGMIFGCGLWGAVADSYGRKPAIILSLLLDFLAAITSSIVNSFTLFLICRFFNGFGIIGATSVIFSYLGEFLPNKERDSYLGKLEIFWSVGMIILPSLAWGLLNRNLFQFADNGNFSPWRIFVSFCSLPSLLGMIALYFLPETPKFLISKGRYMKARIIFQKMYAVNTGKTMSNYPVISLEKEYESLDKDDIVRYKNGILFQIIHKVKELLKEASTLCTQPYLRYLIIVCFADFCLMASYYTLMTWFPEIFKRFKDYSRMRPDAKAGVCQVSSLGATTFNASHSVKICDPSIDDDVFIQTLIIGLSCLPTSISLGYFMKRMGKRTVIVLGLVLSGLSTLSLNLVGSINETLVLSCIFEAFTSILEAVIFCIIVDLFPTNLRAVALAITATSGRIGAITGNFCFGFLIDINCIVPIYLFGSLLLASGIFCLCVPKSDNYVSLH